MPKKGQLIYSCTSMSLANSQIRPNDCRWLGKFNMQCEPLLALGQGQPKKHIMNAVSAEGPTSAWTSSQRRQLADCD